MGNHLVREFIREEYRSVQNVFDSALNGTETANFEVPDDHGRALEILLNATTDAMGAVVGVVGIGQDITARIAQERDARSSTGERRSSAPAPTATSTSGTRRPRKAMRGADGQLRVPLMNKDGTRLINILLNATTRRDAMGGVVGVVGIGQDISEARSRTRRGAQGAAPKQVRQLTEHQRLVCQHAVNTLNDMLDVAKIENGMYTPGGRVVDLGDLCSRAPSSRARD
ncbi:hypothetical protein JL720_11297 [Aureococcus anophagefferens]|nr:hypothetical protein JL720_11297 [Aureococcus anophagefferens]